jgi:hypothetical protein
MTDPVTPAELLAIMGARQLQDDTTVFAGVSFEGGLDGPSEASPPIGAPAKPALETNEPGRYRR